MEEDEELRLLSMLEARSVCFFVNFLVEEWDEGLQEEPQQAQFKNINPAIPKNTKPTTIRVVRLLKNEMRSKFDKKDI